MNEFYKRLTSSKIFMKWRENHHDSFLCSYIIIENPQFDFYNKNGTITSFIMGKEIEVNENQEVFQVNDLSSLNLEEINLTEKQVMKIIIGKYPKERFTKIIIILQKTEKPFWNITLITASLNILNIKIGMDKKIISETFESLSKFMKKVK